MKPFMIATALAMLATPAYAAELPISADAIKACEQQKIATSKVSRKKCIRDMHEDVGFTLADAKRLCDPKNSVACNKLGWSCERGREPMCVKDTPGGGRTSRDAPSE
jgi:hypothetical protein